MNISTKTALFRVIAVLTLALASIVCGQKYKDVDFIRAVFVNPFDREPRDTMPGNADNTSAFIDSRDGKKYRIVKIGEQTWFAENLNYKTHDSWCYDNKDSNCVKYGRLYNWYAANSACPDGWHLPAGNEWDVLFIKAGGGNAAGNKLRAKIGWKDNESMIKTPYKDYYNGSDDYGFSAKPGGRRNYYPSGFYNAGQRAYWWTSVEHDNATAYVIFFDHFNSEHVYGDEPFKGDGFSVRCLQGNPLPPQEKPQAKKSGGFDSLSQERRRTKTSADGAFGTFTDARDGQTYKTVKIGGTTWMAENLNYKTNDSWHYRDDEQYYSKYGRLYTWNAATTACPSGWHLPTAAEWNTLIITVGGTSVAGITLRAKSGWNEYWQAGKIKNANGNDDYGFSALPSGHRYSGGDFRSAGDMCYWWTATEYNKETAYKLTIYKDHDDITGDRNDAYSGFKDFALSVRCIGD